MENNNNELTLKAEQELPEEKTEQISGGEPHVIIKEGEALDSALRRFKRSLAKDAII